MVLDDYDAKEVHDTLYGAKYKKKVNYKSILNKVPYFIINKFLFKVPRVLTYCMYINSQLHCSKNRLAQVPGNWNILSYPP